MPVALSGPGEVDFGHVALVHALDQRHRRGIGHEGGAPFEPLAAGPGEIDDAILGEDQFVELPVLRIERAEIAGLELLDFLDVVHGGSSPAVVCRINPTSRPSRQAYPCAARAANSGALIGLALR